MSRTWRRMTADLLPSSPTQAPAADTAREFQYRAYVAEGRLWQEETRPSDPVHRQVRAASYVVGSGKHAQAFVSEDRGYCVQLPLGWFAAPLGWRMNPGYELLNHRFDRAIAPGCADCHGGERTYIPPTRNRFRMPMSEGIGCEQCHGAGGAHAAYWTDAGAATAGTADPIVNPARLPPARSLDVCLQCHLQGDIVLLRQGHEDFDFVPGERLVDHRVDFLVRTQRTKAIGVSSHGARLMQSRCFLASDGKLTCTSCHDPHAPASAEATASYDRDCQSCHAADRCSRPVAAGAVREASGCVDCHMPRRATREGQHLVITDHLIQRQPAEPPGTSGLSVVPVSDGDQVELVTLQPRSELPGWAEGAGYVLVHESMQVRTSAMEHGARLLADYVRRDPHNPEALYWLASAEIALHRGDQAIPRLEAVLAALPDWPQARYRLAVARDQMQQYGPALALYLELIGRYPDWQEPYPLAVRLQLFQGQVAAAVRLLEQQLSLNEDATAYANLALARRLMGTPPLDCVVLADKAVGIDPRLPLAYLHRGFLLAEGSQWARARQDFERVLQLEPGNDKARTGLESLRRLGH